MEAEKAKYLVFASYVLPGQSYRQQKWGPFKLRTTAEECVLALAGKLNVVNAVIKEADND